ncbi:MAG TPA: GreA/GreB family elongation factor [Planctomycetota bacterium]|nr:GreA/GreB family elongation factor [Planctomycetota bacterium]
MTLAILANEENWQAFDDAWATLIESGDEVDDLVTALEVVGQKRRMARCMVLARKHVETLNAAGRHADSARVLGAALRGGGPVGEIADLLHQAALTAWGSEPWWESYTQLAGFEPGAPDLRKAWMYLDDMQSYHPGAVVFHAAGWGTGEVLEVAVDNQDVEVRFQSGKKDRFPLRTAVEIFERLPETDLRAQHLRDPDGLKKRIKKEPLEILRSILLRYGGKASSMTLRNALMQIGIDGSAWTGWWRKARVAAENSEWFRVSGNATRAEVELLKRALDPVDAIERQLKHAKDLKTALSRVRDLFGGSAVDDLVRAKALDAIEGFCADKREPLEQRLAAWMFLREHRGATPEPLLERLRAAAAEPAPGDPSVAPPLWELINRIPGAREQEAAIDVLQEVLGEAWLEHAVEHMPHAPAGMVNRLLSVLVEQERTAELGQHYVSLLARPTRAPFALIALARLGEDGTLQADLPTGAQRAMALVQLAVHLEEKKRGDTLLTRAHQRLIDLLNGGEPQLLRRLVADADGDELMGLRTALQRGLDDSIDAILTDVALEKGLDLFKAGSRHFWSDDHIWTTREGLQRRERELRELVDKKIPENAEAIARAASYGDLSENSEWEAAIEEQRQLTSAASAMEKELRQAALLENASIPEGTVAPGTLVRYRELEGGRELEIAILGPWDQHPNGVSYRAPLAVGMLGLHRGERGRIDLPSGVMQVEVLDIQLAVETV